MGLHPDFFTVVEFVEKIIKLWLDMLYSIATELFLFYNIMIGNSELNRQSMRYWLKSVIYILQIISLLDLWPGAREHIVTIQ